MRYAKLIFFSVLILALILSYGYFFLCADHTSQAPEVVVVDDWTDTLTVSGYEPAVIVGEPEMPVDMPESVEAVIYTEGTVQDSLTVEVSVVTTPEGTAWVKAEVNGDTVKWHKIQYAQMDKPEHDNDWSLLIAEEWIGGADTGLGIAWEPLQLKGARIGLQAVCDLNPTLTDAPDWGSLSVRISRRFGAVSIGGYGGYRVGEQQGVAVGISAGIIIGI